MGEIKLLPKMRKVLETARQAGWAVNEPASAGEGEVHIQGSRGGEKFWISWTNGAVITTPLYWLDGVEQKVINPAGLYRKLQGAADYKANAKRARRSGSRAVPRSPVPGAVDSGASGAVRAMESRVIGAVSFDADAADPDILRACYNKTVVWQNSITGAIEEAHITRGINWDKVKYNISYSSDGRRILNFVSRTGFRSVAIDRLLQVK